MCESTRMPHSRSSGSTSVQVAGDVVLADERDVGRGGARRLGGADDVLEQHLAGDAVAQVLGADEAGRVAPG